MTRDEREAELNAILDAGDLAYIVRRCKEVTGTPQGTELPRGTPFPEFIRVILHYEFPPDQGRAGPT